VKRIAFSLAVFMVLTATPAVAQVAVIRSPNDWGLTAVTPSRLSSIRREANRGRTVPFEVRLSPREARRYADDLLERAEIRCDVAEAELVAYTGDRLPVLEVDCVEGGGIVVIDSLPIQATDCLDLWPREEGVENVLDACRLPGNVAMVAAARQSARN
jgi:hypothetical protein